MTNKEKYERIKKHVEEKNAIGILAAFMIDDAYKDVEFAKYLKNYDPSLFYEIHPAIIADLTKHSDVVSSCLELLKTGKLSLSTKAEMVKQLEELNTKCNAIALAAKELCVVFDKAVNE